MATTVGAKSLREVIKVDEDKCVNCHMCIAVCPVKYCIDGSGEKVRIIHDLCIGCGSCVEACTHDARSIADDAPAFFDALRRGEQMVAIVAPALVASYGELGPRLLGWLKRLGVKAFFDVGFGAELTVASYLDHVDRNSPPLVIAQPCPAIVSYVEIYRPELLPHLAPSDSPMLHTVKMIREFFPEYAGHKVMVVSPCAAKRREFDETGLGDYNVTVKSLDAILKERKVDLGKEEPAAYENPPAERGVVFSTPGGLLRTALRERPGLAAVARKIEGPELIYPYLDTLDSSVRQGKNPLLVDCLNCAYGCNAGPGTLNVGRNPDEFEYNVEARREEVEKAHGTGKLSPAAAARKVRKVFGKFWRRDLYARRYVDRSTAHRVARPSEAEFKAIYASMKKKEEMDHLNCASCGYKSCEGMAVAIHNGLNRRENCHLYRQYLIEDEKAAIETASSRLGAEVESSRGMVEGIRKTVARLDEGSHSQFAAIEESSAAVEQMIATLGNASRIAEGKRSQMDSLSDTARVGERDMASTVEAIKRVFQSVAGIGEMAGVIRDVADRTNLLSMNAAIEAAHAGDSGRGFGVVAGEIRKLAEATGGNASRIETSLKGILDQMRSSDELSRRTGEAVRKIAEEVHAMAEEMAALLDSMSEMASGGSQVVQGVEAMRDVSMQVKALYDQAMGELGGILEALERIARISEESRRSIEG